MELSASSFRKNDSYSLLSKGIKFKETGSPFDATSIDAAARPGSHALADDSTLGSVGSTTHIVTKRHEPTGACAPSPRAVLLIAHPPTPRAADGRGSQPWAAPSRRTTGARKARRPLLPAREPLQPLLGPPRPPSHAHTPPRIQSPRSLAAPAARVAEFLRKHSGLGGSTVLGMPAGPRVAEPEHAPKKREKASTRRSNPPNTDFRRYYERGDLPICVEHTSRGIRVGWKAEITKLDFHHYLPIFFDGLREIEEPYQSLALHGTEDLLQHGGDKVLPVVPQIILPIRSAWEAREWREWREWGERER